MLYPPLLPRPLISRGLKTHFDYAGRQGDDAKLYDSLFKATEQATAGYTVILGHYLRIGPSDELAKLCEGLIATIDGETFEPYRKTMREMKQKVNEEIRKRQQSRKPQ